MKRKTVISETYKPYDRKTLKRYEYESPRYETVERPKTPADAPRYILKDNVYINPSADTAGKKAEILCVGDLMCEQGMHRVSQYGGQFFFYSHFKYIRDIFKKSDLVVGNLETMICESAPYTGEAVKVDGKYHCNAPVAYLEALRFAGFDMLMLANNHNCDCGIKGIIETMFHLKQYEFGTTGLFTPESQERFLIVSVNSIRVAFLSFATYFNQNETRFTDQGRRVFLNEYRAKDLERAIGAAKKAGAEYIVCYMHWGEQSEYASKECEKQRVLAREVADIGVDCIIGSHPHALQRYETLTAKDGREVFVFYSLGNFVTSDYHDITRETAITVLTLTRNEPGAAANAEVRYIPCHIFNGYNGIGYPVVSAEHEQSEGVCMEILNNTRRYVAEVMGGSIRSYVQGLRGGRMLTMSFIYEALELTKPQKDVLYTKLAFAEDAVTGCAALLYKIYPIEDGTPAEGEYTRLADLAIKKGAKLLITPMQIKDYPCLVVADVIGSYVKICAAIRRNYRPKTIGITGSIGKTTTTEMIALVVNSRYRALCSLNNCNSLRTVGQHIQRLKPEHEVYVQEMMEGPPFGCAARLSTMVQPDAAVLTVVGSAHMEAFGSKERVLESCLGIEAGMPEDGVIFLNGDDPLQWNAPSRSRRVTYGIKNPAADYRADHMETHSGEIRFNLLYENTSVPVVLHCIGAHNVLNALASFAVGKYLGMQDDDIVSALGEYAPSGVRQNLVNIGGYHLYMDCGSAALESMESSLAAFSTIAIEKNNGQKVMLFGNVSQTKGDPSELHRQIGEFIVRYPVDLLICYSRDSFHTAEWVRKNSTIPVFHTVSEDEAVLLFKQHVRPSDVVLVKSSIPIKLEHVIDRIFGTWYHEDFARYNHEYSPYDGDGFKADVYRDHATITRWSASEPDAILPEIVGDRPVTGIERNVFSGKKQLSRVVFPSTLINIRYCSFYNCNNLTEINLPDHLQLIDRSAFNQCANLRTAHLGSEVTDIGQRAFYDCRKLERIVIPTSVRHIGPEAFGHCASLTIIGERSSYAETYAYENQIPFAVL